MKRYWLKFAAFLLALLCPFALYFAYVQALPAQFGGTIMGSLPHKVALAEETEGPRILLVGGSSSPYATNCALIAEETGRACVNLGVTAYLGLPYYLSLLEGTMQAGDIVVLGPEHSMLSGSTDYRTVWMALENHAGPWRYLPAGYYPKLASAYGGYAAEKRGQAKETIGGTPLSYPAGFGPLGDVTLYREPLLESGYNREDPISLSASTLGEDEAEALARFGEKAEAAGVHLYFAWAPVNELALTSTPAEALALEEAVQRQTGLATLGSIEAAILPAEQFYDSNNHLTTAGATAYSLRLAANLRAAGAPLED